MTWYLSWRTRCRIATAIRRSDISKLCCNAVKLQLWRQGTSRLVPLGKAGPPTTNSIHHQTWSCLSILCILMFYFFSLTSSDGICQLPKMFCVFFRNFEQPLLKFQAQLDRHSAEPRPENRRQGSLLSNVLKAFKLLDLLTRPPWSRSWRSATVPPDDPSWRSTSSEKMWYFKSAQRYWWIDWWHLDLLLEWLIDWSIDWLINWWIEIFWEVDRHGVADRRRQLFTKTPFDCLGRLENAYLIENWKCFEWLFWVWDCMRRTNCTWRWRQSKQFQSICRLLGKCWCRTIVARRRLGLCEERFPPSHTTKLHQDKERVVDRLKFLEQKEREGKKLKRLAALEQKKAEKALKARKQGDKWEWTASAWLAGSAKGSNHKHCLTSSAHGAKKVQCEEEGTSQCPVAAREGHQAGQILKAKERFESIPRTFQWFNM